MAWWQIAALVFTLLCLGATIVIFIAGVASERRSIGGDEMSLFSGGGNFYIPPPPPFPTLQAALAPQSLQAALAQLSSVGPSAPAKPLPKAFLAGPIIAWRRWVVGAEGRLVSITAGIEWPAGQPMVGDVDSYGVYALKDRAGLGARAANQVDGQVALWGRVIEHEKGYRAQYGYPVMLDLSFVSPMPGFPRPAMLDRLVTQLRERYGCEVRL